MYVVCNSAIIYSKASVLFPPIQPQTSEVTLDLRNNPQVIFSQSSELLERESSMASSLEEVSGTPGNEPSCGAPPTDHFGVFKDFDFLEYESESIEVRKTVMLIVT